MQDDVTSQRQTIPKQTASVHETASQARCYTPSSLVTQTLLLPALNQTPLCAPAICSARICFTLQAKPSLYWS